MLIFNSSWAENYYRCTDINGHDIFSQEPCGPDAIEGKLPSNIETINPGRNAVQQLENYRKSVERIGRITGSAAKSKSPQTSPCDNVSRMQLRNARVSKDIMQCHSEDDIRHIYGVPKSISTWSDRPAYDTRWRFNDEENDGKIYVYFKDGLVTKWSIHQ